MGTPPQPRAVVGGYMSAKRLLLLPVCANDFYVAILPLTDDAAVAMRERFRYLLRGRITCPELREHAYSASPPMLFVTREEGVRLFGDQAVQQAEHACAVVTVPRPFGPRTLRTSWVEMVVCADGIWWSAEVHTQKGSEIVDAGPFLPSLLDSA